MRKIIVVATIALLACKTESTERAAPVATRATKIIVAKPPSPRDAKTDVVAGMTIPPEFRPRELPPGEAVFTEAPKDVQATIDNALSVYELLTKYQALAQWFQSGVDPTLPAMKKCKDELIARGAVIDKRYEWTLGLRVVADGKNARLAEILVPSSTWPDVFDQEAKDCWLRAVSSISFSSDKVVDVTLEYPLCVNPPEDHKGKEMNE